MAAARMALVLCLSCSSALGAEGPFVVRQGDPATGSHIKREMLRSPLPFDVGYEELSSEQKLQVR